MKEIKFRAKMLDSDDFVYGYYINSELPNEVFKHKIYCSDVNRLADVKEETVGQYTGLKDKNGKEIYEGDIVELKASNGCCEMTGIIIYDEYDLAFELKDIDSETQECLWYQEQELEVIGNIYDNPELLEKESD